MKKNFVRIVAALLIAMLALTLIPMGALALDADYYYVYNNYIDKVNPSYEDLRDAEHHHQYENVGIIEAKRGSISIDTDDYEDYLIWDGAIYDLQGVLVKYSHVNYDDDLVLADGLTITHKNEKKYPNYFDLIYTTHKHKLSYWYSDGTTHWRECLVCKQFKREGFWDQFMYQNWCQDGDEDGICNICGGDVPYHDIEVIDVEGAKITLNRDNASHRTKITADVEAEDGYKVGKVHFMKVRDDGSKQEITRYKKDGQFWTYMPTYEMEVSVDVVKTK